MARSGPEDRQCVFPETSTTDVIYKEVQLSLTKRAILAHASVVRFLTTTYAGVIRALAYILYIPS